MGLDLNTGSRQVPGYLTSIGLVSSSVKCRNEGLLHNDASVWFLDGALKIEAIINNEQLINISERLHCGKKGCRYQWLTLFPHVYALCPLWVSYGSALSHLSLALRLTEKLYLEKESMGKPELALRAGSDMHYFSPSVGQIKSNS